MLLAQQIEDFTNITSLKNNEVLVLMLDSIQFKEKY